MNSYLAKLQNTPPHLTQTILNNNETFCVFPHSAKSFEICNNRCGVFCSWNLNHKSDEGHFYVRFTYNHWEPSKVRWWHEKIPKWLAQSPTGPDHLTVTWSGLHKILLTVDHLRMLILLCLIIFRQTLKTLAFGYLWWRLPEITHLVLVCHSANWSGCHIIA